MRISIIGSKDFDSLEYHTADALKTLGHEVTQVDMSDIIHIKYLYNYWFSKFVPKYVEILFGKLSTIVIESKPDLVICTYRFIPSSAIKKIKSALPGVPTVQLNPDQLTTFEKQQIFYSGYDVYFTKDPFISNFMTQKAGLNAYYLPEAFNQRIHMKPLREKLSLENEINIDVLVFGSIYPYRANMVKQLINAGLNITMFGSNQNPDPELKKYFRDEWITGTRKSEVLVGSKLVFNNFHFAEINSVNCKFFEIAGCGGFQICDYKSTVDEYSIIDSKKFTFNNMSEGIDHIKYYLKKPELRIEMAETQRQHFLKHHTYDIRVQQMLDIIFK
ncbi:MAG: glycosyltransferase [Pedobacter sp.]